MTQPPYSNAPITEAVIEIKFTEPLESSDVEMVSGKFITNYPQHQTVQTINVNLNLPENLPEEPTAKFNRTLGHRYSSVDMTELLIFWKSAFVISQLAPYPGWDVFLQRFKRDWAVWKRAMGFREIARVGVRYVNRIDIPIAGPIVEYEAFLNIYPRMPEFFGSVDAYAVQTVLPAQEIGCKVTLNSAIVPSPILDHLSILFDQDIAREVDPPQSDDAILNLLNDIRVQKNKIFEACITDRARELFSR